MSNLKDLMQAPGAGFEADGDFDKVNALYMEKGWGDGLPLVPPTAQRVEQMLAYCDRPYDQVIGLVAPRYGAATPLRLAANAVMAGCRPEYFPLVMLTIEALCDETFNLYGVNATTHPCSTLMIVNGPVAKELKMNWGHNAFGPGNQANATIGRAVRLAMLNIGGAIPATGDMATFGSPAKYTFCVAENEADNPWQPLHVELGFARDVSTVTVYGAESPHNVNDHESNTGIGVLKMTAGTVAITGANNLYFDGPPLLIFGPEHASTVARDGYSKADVKKFIYEHGRVQAGCLLGRKHRAPHPPVAGVQGRIHRGGAGAHGAGDEERRQRTRGRDRRRRQALGLRADLRRDPADYARAETEKRQLRAQRRGIQDPIAHCRAAGVAGRNICQKH